MSPRYFSVDWGHKDTKTCVYDGQNFSTTLPLPAPDVVILTENLPVKYAKGFLDAGGKVLRCSTHAIIPLREKLQEEDPSWEKSDDNDALLIWILYKRKPNSFREMFIQPKLAIYHRIFKSFQDIRLQIGNQLYADMSEELDVFFQGVRRDEQELLKVLKKEVEKQPIWTAWLSKIKGIGPSLGGGLISLIGPIQRYNTVSKLWAYSGYKVENGEIQKRKAGQVANWNGHVRTLMYNILDQFIKQRTPLYRDLYDQEKAKQLANGLKKGHADNRARRKVAKIFLQHYWEVARDLEGLPISKPWIIEHGGHTSLIRPPEWE